MGDIQSRLTDDERNDLGRLEAVIERGLSKFVEVGNALIEVQQRSLHRESHPTFAAYCQERFGIGRSRAYQLIAAAEVSTTVDNVPNERVARELVKVPPAERTAVLARARERRDGPMTAEVVRSIADGKTHTRPTGPTARTATSRVPFGVRLCHSASGILAAADAFGSLSDADLASLAAEEREYASTVLRRAVPRINALARRLDQSTDGPTP